MPALPIRPGPRPRSRRRLLSAVATALALVAALAWLVAPVADSGAQPVGGDPPVTVEVTPATGLTDGTVVDVTVRARPGVRISTNPNDNQGIWLCRPGVTYTTYRELLPAQGNCPMFLSVSSSSLSSRTLFPLPDGSAARTSMAVGVGTVGWPLSAPTFSLTCDENNPCALVALVRASIDGGPLVDVATTVGLSYATDSPLASCRPADGAFTSAGSDRMQRWWTELSVADCGSSGQVASNFAPLGEGEALAGFASGARDVAYTAAGHRPEVASFNPPTARPAVYTPVSLNAVVIAVVGGNPLYQAPDWPVGLPRPYQDIRLTAAEAAALIGRHQTQFDTLHNAAVRGRNPELPPGELYWLGDTTKVRGTIAVQAPTSVTWLGTTYLDALAPAAWINDAGADRGVVSSFAGAVPGFDGQLTEISTVSQLAALKNVTIQQSSVYPGPSWALTDYATAVALGLTPVAIENAAGQFVTPTPQSLAAAVPTMTVGPDGRRVPDVRATAAGAYPLTMVEYAMAPAEPLDRGRVRAPDGRPAAAHVVAPVRHRARSAGAAGGRGAAHRHAARRGAGVDRPGGCVAVHRRVRPSGGPAGRAGRGSRRASAGRRARVGAGAAGLGLRQRPGRGDVGDGRRRRGQRSRRRDAVDARGDGRRRRAHRERPADAAPVPRRTGRQRGGLAPGAAGRGGAHRRGRVRHVRAPGATAPGTGARTGGLGRAWGPGAPAPAPAPAFPVTAPAPAAAPPVTGVVAGGAESSTTGRRPPRPVSRGAIAWAAAAWLGVTVVAVVLVLYGIGPLLEQRDQTALLADYRVEVRQAANQSLGLPGVEVPTRAPETGAPVAILDIPALRVEQVVVEGVGPQQTRRGPGHVPGTRGPGQPGNSAIVGRRTAFGGPFRTLGELDLGDEILVTTSQGQTIYEVVEVRSDEVADGSGVTTEDATTTTTAPAARPTTGTTRPGAGEPASPAAGEEAEDRAETEPLPAELTTDDLFGRTPDDRLTLVTSAATRPWNTSRATIVVATMRDRPFAPTPQGGRTEADDGRSPDGGAGAALALALLAYLVAVVVAVVLYRTARPRSAYLLTAPPLLAATMLAAEATARVLPAWL